jgi:hypothetical protein
MFVNRALAHLRVARFRACTLGPFFVLCALVPLAHVCPPDPLWIVGVYDERDFDDVVVAVDSTMARAEVFRFCLSKPPILSVATLPMEEARVAVGPPFPSLSIRAPPTQAPLTVA